MWKAVFGDGEKAWLSDFFESEVSTIDRNCTSLCILLFFAFFFCGAYTCAELISVHQHHEFEINVYMDQFSQPPPPPHGHAPPVVWGWCGVRLGLDWAGVV